MEQERDRSREELLRKHEKELQGQRDSADLQIITLQKQIEHADDQLLMFQEKTHQLNQKYAEAHSERQQLKYELEAAKDLNMKLNRSSITMLKESKELRLINEKQERKIEQLEEQVSNMQNRDPDPDGG